jgi:hypothetical protein
MLISILKINNVKTQKTIVLSFHSYCTANIISVGPSFQAHGIIHLEAIEMGSSTVILHFLPSRSVILCNNAAHNRVVNWIPKMDFFFINYKLKWEL